MIDRFTIEKDVNSVRTKITIASNIKDFFFCDNNENFRVTDIMYEPYFTYEYKKTSELLLEMQKNSVSISIVLDEYGASVGMISLEDLLEEIVGDIADEHDLDIQGVRQETDGSIVVDGSVPIRDLNRALDWSLPDMNGGELIAHLLAAGRALPGVIVVVSAGDAALLRQESIPPGVADVVQKPLTPDLLRKLCHAASAGNKPVESNAQAQLAKAQAEVAKAQAEQSKIGRAHV